MISTPRCGASNEVSPSWKVHARACACLGAVALSLTAVTAGCDRNGSAIGASIQTAMPDQQAQVRAAFVAARQAAATQEAPYAVRAQGAGFAADNPVTHLTVVLGDKGVTLGQADEPWSASVAASQVGCVGQRLASVERTSSSSVSANRVEYSERAGETGLTEWYVHGSLGLEHGFTLESSTCASGEGGDVLITVSVEGLAPLEGPSGVELRDGQNMPRLRYTDLSATDAAGKMLRVGMGDGSGSHRAPCRGRGRTLPVQVDPLFWVQTAELTADDGAADDQFGSSVSISGSIAVIGAPSHMVGGDAGQGAEQGAAYVFVESGGTWTQQQELTASDGMAYDSFGEAVAISGNTLVVGAPYHTVGANGSQGAAYVFVQSGTTWTQQEELTSGDGQAYDSFGEAIAISGSTALVGAFEHPVGANGGQGAAYVFVQSGSTWTQQGELTASDGESYDYFGASVSVSGSTALVGAQTHAVGANRYQGAAYVFVKSGGTWTQQQELTASDGAADDSFGTSAFVSGTTAAVGAPSHMVGANMRQGAAYVFVEGDGGAWTQQQELTASDGRAHDSNFGESISVSGGTVVVGSYSKTLCSSEQGAAYVYVEGMGGTWTQQQELTASDGVASDGFGFAVSVSGSTALAGGSSHQVGANAYQGAAYVENVEEIDAGTAGLVLGNGGLFCATGLTNCSCLCENLKVDLDNCGACGNPCQPGQACSGGTCVLYCQPGLTACGGVCVDEQTDPNNCNACGTKCPAGNLCAAGACVVSCQAGLTNCGGTCVDEQTDPDNCGGCASPCPAGNLCAAAACVVSCQTGQTNCSNTCVNEQTDPDNCGACANKCSTGDVCSAGICVVSCQPGQTNCGDTCVDEQTDPDNCGVCANKCPAGNLCSAGSCVLSCPAGQTNCSGTCVDEQIDPDNCGACGNKCSANGACASAACVVIGAKSSGCSASSDGRSDAIFGFFAVVYLLGLRRSRGMNR